MILNKNILLIDKPKDWTSFDVVAKVRGAYRSAIGNKKAKVGHAGTLDPFATGLLIVLLGDATKKQDSFMKLDKKYEATLKLGFTSTTGDPEGKITPCQPTSLFCHPEEQYGKVLRREDLDCHVVPPRNDEVEDVLQKYSGEIEQTPHAFSAIKVDGKRAYELARAGKEVEIKPRLVNLYEIKLVAYKFPELKIKVNCSSGTYIRSLAEDIGKELGCGAYLTELRRTKIGNYEITDAFTIEEILTKLNNIDFLA